MKSLLLHLERGKVITQAIYASSLLNILLFVLLIYLNFSVSSACTNTKTVLISTESHADQWVAGDRASKDYIERTAFPFLQTLGNLSHSNSTKLTEWLMLYVYPSDYDEVNSKLEVIKKQMDQGDISHSFNINKIIIKSDEQLVIGEGLFTRKVSGTSVTNKIDQVSVKYMIFKGRFYVADIFVPGFDFS